jgi:hypothetical protein
MKHPGVWVLGDLADDDRRHGMGIVVEYAGQTGQPQWLKPKPFYWDYARFGGPPGAAAAPNETIEMTIVKRNAAAKGFNLWTLNGQAFSMHAMQPMYEVHAGRRYRLRIRNASDDLSGDSRRVGDDDLHMQAARARTGLAQQPSRLAQRVQ